ncbi:MAG: MFS transporter [Oligoflexus sp.]
MSSVKLTRDEMKLLVVLAGIQFMHIVDFMIIMPLGPVLMRELAIRPQQFSFLVSAYTFFAGGTGLFAAFFLDRFDRRKSLLFFFSGFTLGTLTCALADSYQTLLAARALTGAFGGVLNAQVYSIIGDVIEPHKRGRATGVIMGAFSLASIFGVPIGLWLANLGNWHTPLFVLASIALPMIFFAARVIPALRSHIIEDASPPWEFLRTVPFRPRPRLALLLMISMVLGQFSVIPFLSPSLVTNAGLTESQLPLIYLIGGFVSIFSSPIVGRFCDRHGPIRVLLVTAPLSMVPFLMITNLNLVPLFIAIFVSALFFVFMGARMVPTMTIVTGSVLPHNRGAFMSLTNAVQQLSAASASLIAGYVITMGSDGRLENYHLVGFFAVVLTLVSVSVAYALRHEPVQVLTYEARDMKVREV